MHVLHAEEVRINEDYRSLVPDKLLVKITQLTSMEAKSVPVLPGLPYITSKSR